MGREMNETFKTEKFLSRLIVVRIWQEKTGTRITTLRLFSICHDMHPNNGDNEVGGMQMKRVS